VFEVETDVMWSLYSLLCFKGLNNVLSTVEFIYRLMLWASTYGRMRMKDWLYDMRPAVPVADRSTAPDSKLAANRV